MVTPPSRMRAFVVAFAFCLVAAAAGQGRLLHIPKDVEPCLNRPKDWKFGDNYYFFSGDLASPEFQFPNGSAKGVDWLEARNLCRQRCMDAVSMESEAENNMVFEFIASRPGLQYIWTSGRLCDFTGCEKREDLKPFNIKGWFWSNTNTKMAPTNLTPPGWAAQPWSFKGHTGGPQPDNAEFDINQTSESCMAVLNDVYKGEGIKWHDIACYHKKPFICEDSASLLAHVAKLNNVSVNVVRG